MCAFLHSHRLGPGHHHLLLRLVVQFSQLCPSLCDPMDCGMPGLAGHHQLPEFTQTHVHQVSDTVQPSHPLSSPFPPAFNLSQRQALFQWVSSLHQVAKGLAFQLQPRSFQIVLPMSTQDWFPLGWTGEYTINIWWMTISQEFTLLGHSF